MCFQVLCGTSLYPVTQTPILEWWQTMSTYLSNKMEGMHMVFKHQLEIINLNWIAASWSHWVGMHTDGLESKYFVFEALLFQRSGLGCIIFMLIELVIAPHKLIGALHNDKIVKSRNNQFCIWSLRLYCHSGKEAAFKIETSSQDC